MCVILTAGEVIALEVLCRTLKVFICEPCDLERSLAEELIMDITRWQLFLEASQNQHYQNWEVLFWQRSNFCVSGDYLPREIILPHYKMVQKIPLSMAAWNRMSYKQTLGGYVSPALQNRKM